MAHSLPIPTTRSHVVLLYFKSFWIPVQPITATPAPIKTTLCCLISMTTLRNFAHDLNRCEKWNWKSHRAEDQRLRKLHRTNDMQNTEFRHSMAPTCKRLVTKIMLEISFPDVEWKGNAIATTSCHRNAFVLKQVK